MIFFWLTVCVFIFYHLWQKIFYIVVIAVLSRGRKKIKKKNMNYLVSIIVPAYNEEKVIARRIRNLLSQNYKNMEIIVVESGSTDKTYEKAASFGKKIKVLKQKKRSGKASAVNFAMKHAKGDIIMVTDANAVFRRNTVKKMVMGFADPSVGGVCGRYRVSNPDTPLTRIVDIYWWIEYKMRLFESNIYSLTTFSGEITAFRKGIIKANEKSLSEDFEMALQIIRKGGRVVYEPEAVVYEANPTNFREEIKQKTRRAIGTIQTLSENRDLLFNRKYGLFSSLVLPTHKMSPLLHPFVDILMLIAITIYFPLISIYILLFYLACSVTYVLIPPLRKLTILPLYFLVLDFTVLAAWFKYIRGSYSVRWETTQSTRI